MTTKIPRSRLLAVPASILAVGLAVGCGAAQTPTQAPAAPGASGVTEYVGTVPGTEYFIAVATSPRGDVEAYLCDGRGGAALFTGRVENGRLALQPGGQPGAWQAATDLDGTVSDTTVDGTVALAGQQRSFRAEEATGPGGLYTFTVADEGSRLTGTGTSERGNKIEAAVQDGQTSATLTTPDGQTRPLQPGELPPPGQPKDVYTGYRVVMLDNVTTRGKNLPNASKSGTGDTGFTSREIDF